MVGTIRSGSRDYNGNCSRVATLARGPFAPGIRVVRGAAPLSRGHARSAAAVSVRVARQERRQRCEFDAFLAQLVGLFARRLSADRPRGNFLVVNLARLFRKAWP